MTQDVHLLFGETNRKINMDELLSKLNIKGTAIYTNRFISQNTQEDVPLQKLYNWFKTYIKYIGVSVLLMIIIFAIAGIILYVFLRVNKFVNIRKNN